MHRDAFYHVSPHAIAVIGNFLPRKCGIATFTTDLVESLSEESPEVDCWAVVMNDVPKGYPYPGKVRFELNYKALSDYRLAADFLNMNLVDVVSLQHEYGIFGGKHGAHILELLRNLRMPVVTTLHTVALKPDQGQKVILEEIGRISDRMVVMSRKAGEVLKKVYDIQPEKITFIPHGIPDVPFVDPGYYKDQFGVEGHRVILTFGLLSQNKGIDYMIRALPEVIDHYPKTAYIILGVTHPNVKRAEGESYRLSLQRMARDLGVEDHIIFHNRFVELKELCEFLGAADIYVTPYLNREQIVSGTLAYALGAGKAVISTPYWYAEEMLKGDRGRIVPFEDSKALAAQVIELLDDEVEFHAMRKKAYNFCRNMIWKEVARSYLEIFADVKKEREHRPRVAFQTRTLEKSTLELPQVRLNHLVRLTDDVGLLQHARFIVPDRSHGYCTDDNARAIIAVLMAQDLIPEGDDLVDLAARYLSFVNHAFNGVNGRFRNFMSYDRKWLEDVGSPDSHGRAIWGLGMAVAFSKSDGLTSVAMSLFERALPAVLDFKDPRAWAFSLVGIHAYLRRFGGDSGVRRARKKLANLLFDLYREKTTDEWPWLEPVVTYANAKIPQALLLSGQWLQRGEMIEAGLRLLNWLVDIQIDSQGHFVPVGNHGWLKIGGDRARFDQQPIEAMNMIEACKEAYNVTRDEKWINEAHRCLDWFLGRNDLNTPLYDYRTGGCCDGLTADGANQNQGAESTLAWLISLLNMYAIRAAKAVTTCVEDAEKPVSRQVDVHG